jgi:predicted nucleic acid-binding protein
VKTSSFVLDSSLALAFVLKDEATPESDKILDGLGQGAVARVPALWRWEVANALLMAERRNRITSAENHRHLAHFRALPIEVDAPAFEEAWSGTHVLARKHRLTVYDAAYLETAIRLGVALGSLDAGLRAAAKAEKVPLLPEKLGS